MLGVCTLRGAMLLGTRAKIFTVPALLAATLSAGCDHRVIAPTDLGAGTTGSASVLEAKAGAGNTPYNLTFSDDIQSGNLPVLLNKTAPWKNINLENATLTLPGGPLLGCPEDLTSWSGNANTVDDPYYTGVSLSLRQKSGSSHLDFASNDPWFVNVAVNHETTTDEPTPGVFVLTFTNTKALVGANSKDPSADPCVTFSITARPQ